MFVYKVIENPNNPATFKGIIGFYKQHFAVVIVYHIKGSKLATVTKYVMYKIDAPGVIKCLRYINSLLYP